MGGGSSIRKMVSTANAPDYWLLIRSLDIEATEFQEIRLACLPELILAYLSALNLVGYALTRKYLAKALDLAGVIAKNGSDIIETFVAARRMSELVNMLTATSKHMLHAEEVKPLSSGKRGMENAAIWTVRALPP